MVKENYGYSKLFNYPIIKVKKASYLYLGLKAGGNFYRSDPSDLMGYSSEVDPTQKVLSQFNPNIGAGAYFENENYWVSFSIPRLFNANRDSDLAVTAKDRVHTYLGAGMTYPLNETFDLKPSFIYRKVKGLPSSFDITSFISYQNYFDLGFSYRTNASTSIMAICNLINGLQIGYAYEAPSEQMLSGMSLKTHEIILKINLRNKSQIEDVEDTSSDQTQDQDL